MKAKREKLMDETARRLAAEAKPIRKWLILGAVLDILAVLCAVAAPELLGDTVQKLYDFGTSGTGAVRSGILPGLLLLAGVYVASAVLGYVQSALVSNMVSRHYCCQIRIKISDKLRRLPVKFVDQTPVGEILQRMTGDVSVISGYIYQIFEVAVEGIFKIVMICIVMFLENWLLACLVLAMMPASVWLSGRLAGRSGKYFDKMYETSGKLTELVEEAFTNYPTTKAYNLEETLGRKHDALNQALAEGEATAVFTDSVVQPLIRFVNSLAYILIALVGTWLVVEGRAGVGTVVTVILYARQFAAPLEQIARGMADLNHIKASARRVFALLDMEEETAPTAPAEAVQGRVEFQNVRFFYKEEEPLIEDLSLGVEPGSTVAIVGPTGAGKTTIVNLLMRFYDPVAGCIRLDGRDISEISRESIRENIGMVLQDTWLFRGTVAENVAYGRPDATREEIEDACRRACCDRFIRTMPQGYDTVIGEDSTNLSGGQKQLLTIARAMLRSSPLLILDEATSNVDTRTEVLIRKAMDELMRGKTCFVIAHRLSTIVDSDLILVLDHGNIIEQGTHRQLLEKKGFYCQLYESQYAV